MERRRPAGKEPRRGPWMPLALAGLIVAGAACGGAAQPPPRTEPVAPVEPTMSDQEAAAFLLALQEEAEAHVRAGEQSYEQGRFPAAKGHFESALAVYLEAEIPAGREEEFQAAFHELFNRIHVTGLDELAPRSDQLVSLNEELLPPADELDGAHLERLRARLEANLPELPRFTVPVPYPLENDKVLAALEYLTTDRREVIQEGLSRATRYMPLIQEIFAEEGVPAELAWVPLIESLFKPNAYSRASAVGMWQFMSGTAKLLGMRVDWSVDERRDPVRATRAAARYLKDLHQRMDGNWDLAIAAYNGGWGRVQRAAARRGTQDFWELAETRILPRETRDFVPKIYAAILIGTDPASYGLTFEPQEPLTFDEADVDSPTDLRVLAEAAGTTLEVIQELNPHLKMVTPNVDHYTVRVPAGRQAAFATALAAIPPDERVEFFEHRVARGESLGAIASRYGTQVSAIQEMNDIRNPHRIREGQRLVIPVGVERRGFSGQPVSGYESGEQTTYRVARGDSLAHIARSFRTSVPALMRWNNLESSLIFPGDELIVYYGLRGDPPATTAAARADAPRGPAEAETGAPSTPSPAAPAAEQRGLYTVRRGDSLYDIAQRFDTTIDDLTRWNGRGRNATIFPGEKLVVYSDRAVFDDRAAGGGTTAVRRYRVARGDSPYEIARRFGVGLEALLAANNLGSRSPIYPGDELLIPGGDVQVSTYTVRRGDTPGRIASVLGVPLERLLEANGLSRRSTIYPGDRLVVPGR